MNLFLTTLESISKNTPLENRLRVLDNLFPTVEEKFEVLKFLTSTLEKSLLQKRKVSVVVCEDSYGFEIGDLMEVLQKIDPTIDFFKEYGHWNYDEEILDKIRYHPYFIWAIQIKNKKKSSQPGRPPNRRFVVKEFELSPLETIQIVVGHVYSDDGDEKAIVRMKRLDELEIDPIPTYENLRPQEEVERELEQLLN